MPEENTEKAEDKAKAVDAKAKPKAPRKPRVKKVVGEAASPTRARRGKVAEAGKQDIAAYFASVGRRKTSVARVRLSKGKGNITVNGKTMAVYFPDKFWQQAITSPLVMTGNQKNLDVSVLAHGGGVNSQAQAVRHGIARALEQFDASLRPTLKKAGFLTRDPREKERKKYGLKRARRAPQFSKR